MLRAHFSGGPKAKHSSSKRGSFEMRGRQIASTRPDLWTCDWESGCYPQELDVFVNIKTVDPRAFSAPISIYDIVDSWPQRMGEDIGHKLGNRRKNIIQYFKRCWAAYKNEPRFDAWIFPNRTMHKDLSKICPTDNSTVIYHHYDPRVRINPIREKLTKVGYEGYKHFLGEWRGVLEEVCARQNLEFVRNPKNVADVDILVAVRGGEYGSLLSRSYKSNVKLANAYGSGTPALVWPEASYVETGCASVRYFRTVEQLERELEHLRDHHIRQKIHEAFLNKAPAFSLQNIAKQYEIFFETLIEVNRERMVV